VTPALGKLCSIQLSYGGEQCLLPRADSARQAHCSQEEREFWFDPARLWPVISVDSHFCDGDAAVLFEPADQSFDDVSLSVE
jgi:hypothetical protein